MRSVTEIHAYTANYLSVMIVWIYFNGSNVSWQSESFDFDNSSFDYLVDE